MIEQANETEALRPRNEFVDRQKAPVRAPDPHQALVASGTARADLDDRLEHDEDATLVERGDDLVGRMDVGLALDLALWIGAIGLERAVPFGACAVERILGAGEHVVRHAGMTRRRDAADRHGRGHRAGLGLEHVVTDSGKQAIRRDRQVVRCAVVQDDPELVAGYASEMILPAHLRVQALGDAGDHLIGDVEAVGLVDAAEIVDRGQQEAAGGTQLHGFFDRGLENLHHADPVQFTGQGIEPRQIGQLLFPLVALVDGPHDPMSVQRLAVRPGEPPPGVLDPDRLAGRPRRPQGILQLIGNAGTGVASPGAHQGVGARGAALRIDELGIRAAARKR